MKITCCWVCNYLSDYSPWMFSTTHLEASGTTEEHFPFFFARRYAGTAFFFFSAAFSATHNTDLDKLSLVHFLLIMEANVLQCILCNCLRSSYAAYARGSILSDVICSPRASSTVHCAFVTLWVLPLGIEKLPINPFLCFSRILQCICEKWVASGGVELFGVFFRGRAENAPWNCSFASRLLHTRVHYLSITSSGSIESYSPGPF